MHLALSHVRIFAVESARHLLRVRHEGRPFCLGVHLRDPERFAVRIFPFIVGHALDLEALLQRVAKHLAQVLVLKPGEPHK